ncbi:kinase-like domain-containing protein [Lyophyllum atratum]|nr:kinase-like domain-containing protein [Lyophyllum atratum]
MPHNQNMVEIGRPAFNRAFTNAVSTPTESRTPTVTAPAPRVQTATVHVKRVTLTSKKNWWMVEMDEEEEKNNAMNSFSSSDDASVDPMYNYRHGADQYNIDPKRSESPPPSPIYNPPRHPTSIFSFPTPTAYSAPPNPTGSITPCARGSASELFKCIVKKPDVVQLEINGDMHSNASDVTVQFLAELRVYTTLARHRNICAFLGSLENVGLVLEYLEGRTLYDVVIARPPLSEPQKIDYHNQLLDGLTHLHSYRLSHGDLSLLNVQVTSPGDTIKLLDFGRSVSADSIYRAPEDEPVDPFDSLHRKASNPAHIRLPAPRFEQIHPGTRPFSAPEILRGECQDARLADAYSFGMILVCLDRCESVDVKPWDQRKDLLPKDLFDGCVIFQQRAREYLKKCTEGRRRLLKGDMIDTDHPQMET